MYIDKDVINDVFSHSRMDEAYVENRDNSYSLIYSLTKSNLEVDNNVLLDAPFSSSQL